MEFLSFDELKANLSSTHHRNVENAETTHFIKKNKIPIFNMVNGFSAGNYENVLTLKLIKEIFRDLNYIEVFPSNELNSLMIGDMDKLSINCFKSIYDQKSNGDGFIFLPDDIYERMILECSEGEESLELPVWKEDIKKYYRPSEVLLEITRNSLCISKTDLEVAIGEPLDGGKEAFDDFAKLKGIHKTNRYARDRRGMARILAKYIEGKMDDKNYKLIDVANEVIQIMESFNLETIPKADQIKGFIRNEVDPCATNPGISKRKTIK
ncbi:hypothetical protein ACBQ24_09035 [Acinetobacter terrestris]|uniref:hypothetical protein n=1 Tax=Acinetobacter terrestris TaxID=2529843 RepID=UPI00103F976E|nr:hypothetical protein [Acinetobacter terrestris]TCB57500.1 hypothetical protein E0H84_00030 [Acinetobacter terrestris]